MNMDMTPTISQQQRRNNGGSRNNKKAGESRAAPGQVPRPQQPDGWGAKYQKGGREFIYAGNLPVGLLAAARDMPSHLGT